MNSISKIEWTKTTWNPVTGCSKYSLGCKNCYAERFAKRLQAIGYEAYRNGFEVRIHEEFLNRPLKVKSPKMIFVNSMSDLFHDAVPFSFIEKVFFIMNKASWHIFQILTKRSERLLELSSELPWAPNIWAGVTVEHYNYLSRIEHLSRTDAAIKFISCEPLLSPIHNLNLESIDWVIVGGESGPGARPMNKSWVTGIRDQCLSCNVPFFFKQWGGFNKKRAGRLLDGKVYDEMPCPINMKPTQLNFNLHTA